MSEFTGVRPPIDPRATPQSRRTAAVVITSLGALLLGAAATVFMVIAWDLLRLPGKVVVVGAASAAALLAGQHFRFRLPGVAAVLTHLGAVLAPLVAGAGAVALGADRATVAVAGGVVGLLVLEMFDRLSSPALAVGRGLAGAGVAVGIGVWLGVSPALILLAIAATAALVQRPRESIAAALVAASTPLLRWGSAVAEPGSLLPWLNDLAMMDQWLTSLVAVGSLMVIIASTLLSARSLLAAVEARWSMLAATVVFVTNVASFADTLLNQLDVVILTLAASALMGRVVEGIYAPSIRRVVDGAAWIALPLVWCSIIASDSVAATQRVEVIASLLILLSWLVADVFCAEQGQSRWSRRLFVGAAGTISSAGIVVSGIALAVAGEHATGAVIGLVTLAVLLGISERAHRTEFALATATVSLVAAAGSPAWLPAVSFAAACIATVGILRGLRAGDGPRSLIPVQLISLAIASTAALMHPLLAGTSWLPASLHLMAIGTSAVVLTRRSHVPDFSVAPRAALAIPVLATLGAPTLAGVLALCVGCALVVDYRLHGIEQSKWFGFIAATTGSVLIAADAGVTATEAYLALPCLVFASIGYDIVRRGGSSWVAMAPAVGLFCAAGIIERLDEGDGWHSLLAGAVAVVAIIVGVDRRWAGPSLVGSVALVSILGVETAAYVPDVPLWIWLAVGGITLIGAGVHLERSVDAEGTTTLRAAWASFR